MSETQLIYGWHAVEAVLRVHAAIVKRLFLLEERHDVRSQLLLRQAQEAKIPLKRVTRKELEALAAGMVHQGVAAECERRVAWTEDDLELLLESLAEPALLLILDGVQDPHNLGACLRSANAAGVHAVIAPKDKAAGLSPAVRKVACGAAEVTPFIQVTNLARCMRGLQQRGVWLYGLTLEAEADLFAADLTGPVGLVLGSEANGLRRLTRDSCDTLVNIPMRGSVESLNVSVSTGISLFEAMRQRLSKGTIYAEIL